MAMQVKAYSISQITALIRDRLEEEFLDIWVEGEVSDLRTPSSGHIYFILKDKTAQLRCVLFKGSQRFIRFEPKDGMMLLVRGNITVYERRGEYQFICDYLEPMGSGALQMAFEQLKSRLANEGLFDEKRKRPIPLWPKRIGVVTSPTGAAIRDILNILTRRFTTVEVLINPVRVQGEGAAQEIAKAIKELEGQAGIDVIIVARGGGSLEDLWAFNEEIVARAIYSCRVPVISAIGHEIDYTISDFVADLRAPTPSAAAELVIQNREQLEKQLATFENKLTRIITHKAEMGSMRLLHLIGGRVFRDPWVIIRERQESVDDIEIRLLKALSHSVNRSREKMTYTINMLHRLHPAQRLSALLTRVTEQRRRLAEIMQGGILNRRQAITALMAALDALSPLNVLKRGYSLCWRLPDEKLVKDEADLNVRDLLRLRFHKGDAICEVKSKGNEKKGEIK